MSELERAHSMIHRNPTGDVERTLHHLIAALETRGTIEVSELYELDYESFRLALGVMDRWRLHQYGWRSQSDSAGLTGISGADSPHPG